MEKHIDEEVLTEEMIVSMAGKESRGDVFKINCFAMGIKSICNLESFTSLEVVSLSLNSISSLAEFEHCTSLKELYIRKNNISDLTQIRYLKKLPLLSVLFLADNPCSASTNYRAKVIRILQNVRKLDTDVVQASERHEAAVAIDKDIIAFEKSINGDITSVTSLEGLPSLKAQSKCENEISNTLKAVQLLMVDMSPADIQQISRWCEKRLLENCAK